MKTYSVFYFMKWHIFFRRYIEYDLIWLHLWYFYAVIFVIYIHEKTHQDILQNLSCAPDKRKQYRFGTWGFIIVWTISLMSDDSSFCLLDFQKSFVLQAP